MKSIQLGNPVTRVFNRITFGAHYASRKSLAGQLVVELTILIYMYIFV